MAKLFVIIVLLIILFSLGSGLFYLVQNKRDGKSLLKALTWRIALSVSLFLFLIIGFYAGIILPHSL